MKLARFLIRVPAIARDFAIANQINAASVSTMANIAEGFVRGGGKEFVHFVRIAAASNAEARALLHAAYGRRHLEKQEYERLVEMTQSIGRMLRVLEQRLRERAAAKDYAPASPKNQAPGPPKNQAPGPPKNQARRTRD